MVGAIARVVLLSMACRGLTAPAVSPAPSHSTSASYGHLPLVFEKNEGQTDSQVQFVSRIKGGTLFLTGNAAVISLHRNEPDHQRRPAIRDQAAIRMKLLDSNACHA